MLAGTGAVFYFGGPQGAISAVETELGKYTRHFPEFASPKEISLSCDYNGKLLSIQETLYGSTNEYYKSEPKKKTAYFKQNDKDFVFIYPEDKAINEITEKIVTLGKINGLNSDQTLDLGACMIQNIPYDSEKASKILGPNYRNYPISEIIPRYPYETLYENSGLCSDKTFLGAAILGGMGYETGILTFEKEKHMALGVGAPAGYTSFGTKYSIMELTNPGFRVGDIPELDSNIGTTTNIIQSKEELDVNSGLKNSENGKAPVGTPSDIEDVSTGSKYQRIIERYALKQKIDSLSAQLTQKQTEIEVAEQQYTAQKAKIEPLQAQCYQENDCDAYNALVPTYNSSVNAFNKKINEYNSLVKQYNSAINSYNSF